MDFFAESIFMEGFAFYRLQGSDISALKIKKYNQSNNWRQ